jgi:ribosomal protein S12 methylthiotransferase
MLCLLDEAGFRLVSEPSAADAVVINTCGFIDEAKSEAIGVILEMAQLKKEGKLKKIIVAGCLAERYKEELLEELPEVDAVLGVGSFGDIVTAVEGALLGECVCLYGDRNAPVEELPALSPPARLGLPPHCRGLLQPLRLLRHPLDPRALPLPTDGKYFPRLRAGAERCEGLILVAQDVQTTVRTCTGGGACRPAPDPCRAPRRGVAALHYCTPTPLTGSSLTSLPRNRRSSSIWTSPSSTSRRISGAWGGAARAPRSGLCSRCSGEYPGVVLRTSLSQASRRGGAEFEELCDFLRETRIERAGVFPYSPEEGTPAAEMPDRCEAEEARRRAERIMELQAEVMEDFCRSRIGQIIRVLCEGFDEEKGCLYGRSEADSPEIDGLVYFRGWCEPGEMTSVRVTETFDGDLVGEEE